jgi:hypothetical protein
VSAHAAADREGADGAAGASTAGASTAVASMAAVRLDRPGHDPVWTKRVADRTVGESLAQAIAAGALIESDTGALRVADARATLWMKESRDASRQCRFYMGVMFEHVYRRTQVPSGCAACFKVKVVPRSLRELVAVRDVAHALPYTYKCGLDESSPYTSGIYGCYFYLTGLDGARAAYPRIRQAVSEHPRLGADVPVFIKRGCTEYEVHCGPSNQFTFGPEQADLERAILANLEVPDRGSSTPTDVLRTFARWIETAYRLGDDTYLDFTGGRRLFPAVVRYDPDPPAAGCEHDRR